MPIPTRDQLMGAFGAAVAAADPAAAVARHLSVDDETVLVDGTPVGHYPPDRIAVVGIGKAAVAMAAAVCDITGASAATVATPYPTEHDERISVFVGGHPIPDEESLASGRALVDVVGSRGSDDLIIAVVSGGGSAAAEVPAEGVSLDDIVLVNRWLLRSGLSIVDMNEVRSAVSGLKAGRLVASTEAKVVTLVLSDVVGAGPEFVASGPTIPSVLGARAREILASRPDSGDLPPSIRNAAETPKPVTAHNGPVCIVGGPVTAAEAAAAHLTTLGFDTSIITTSLEGETRLVVDNIIRTSQPGVVCVATGETTVTVSGTGTGGRNQEAAIAAMSTLADVGGIFVALGTDGIDGPTGAAGAVVDSESQHAAADAGWDVAAELANNNANPLLADIDALVTTGPTGTNVCDLWMWFVPTPNEGHRTTDDRRPTTDDRRSRYSSALGRPIDWRYASNRFAMAVFLIALALFVGAAWWDARFSYLGAFAAAIAVFLAWAIGRELDPGHTSVAAIATVSAVGVVFIGVPAALVIFAAMIAIRGVAGTAGSSLKWGDLIPLGIAGYASGGSVWFWSIAIILFAWLKSAPDLGRRRWWGMAALGIGFAIGWYLGDLDPIVFSAEAAFLGLGVVVLTLVAVVDVSKPGRTDSGKREISVMRVRLARLAGGIICLSAVLVGGKEVLIHLGPVVGALGATALVVLATLVGLVRVTPESEAVADPVDR